MDHTTDKIGQKMKNKGDDEDDMDICRTEKLSRNQQETTGDKNKKSAT